MSTGNNKKCLNCSAEIGESFQYCAMCSQRTRESKISVGKLFRDFIAGFFNFDSRFYQTCKQVLLPGKLTKEYISGRRKKYINPARFFLFGLIVFFPVITFLSKEMELEINNSSELSENVAEIALMKRYDSLVTHIPIYSSAQMDTLKSKLFQNSGELKSDSFDLSTVISFSTADTKKGVFHISDILNMDDDEFLNHYNIEGFQEKLFVKQSLRVYRNPRGTLIFFISNLLWAVVLSVILLAGVLKMLHFRKKYYYVEHLVLLLHIHGFLLLLAAFLLVITSIAKTEATWVAIAFSVLFFMYFIFSFKNYYKQGYFKTFTKFFIFFISYQFIIAIFASIIFIVSILVF